MVLISRYFTYCKWGNPKLTNPNYISCVIEAVKVIDCITIYNHFNQFYCVRACEFSATKSVNNMVRRTDAGMVISVNASIKWTNTPETRQRHSEMGKNGSLNWWYRISSVKVDFGVWTICWPKCSTNKEKKKSLLSWTHKTNTYIHIIDADTVRRTEKSVNVPMKWNSSHCESSCSCVRVG